jgi:hypothetical protein
MKKLVSISMFMILATLFTQAQVSMTTSGTYSQDFNSLANTGTTVGWFNNSTLANWYAAFQTGTLSVYRPDNGSTNTGSIYSYGLAGSTERTLGSLSSGTPVVVAYGVQMQNNSAVTISNINVTYVGEQWRCGGKITQDTLYFYYKVSPTAFTSPEAGVVTGWTKVPALCFASPTNTTTTGPLDGNASANQTIFNNVSIPSISIPAGEYVMFRWYDINEAGGDHGFGVDSLFISWTIPTGTSVNTGTVSGSPFCVTSTVGASVTVPYTISGTFNAGNAFEAYLSDASGSFASETLIGSVTAITDGSISATIPAGTAAGNGYRIRVKATNPATTGADNGSNLTVFSGIPAVTFYNATPGPASVNLSWTNPSGCYDEIMIVAKPSSTVGVNASGDGTAYTANSTDFTDALNTVFDGTGKVVYKSATPGTSANITGLTNGTPYYFRFFTRKGTEWNNAIEINTTPSAVPHIVITEIMYDDPSIGTSGDSLEFVEIYNNESVPVNISKWYFNAGITYTFPAGTIMAAGEYKVVAKNATAFTNFFGAAPSGTFTGALSNSGELLSLADSLGNIADSLTYGTGVNWPSSPSGNGPSLVLCDPSLDNALASSWSAANSFVDSLNHIAVYANPLEGCPVPSDLIPPVATAAFATSLSTVKVAFDEPLLVGSAENIIHYTWHTAVTGTATLLTSQDSVSLTLSTPLTAGVTDTLTVAGISDVTGNIMSVSYKFPIVFGSLPTPAVDTLVWWNFPNVKDDTLADGGIPANLTKLISREAGFTGANSYTTGASSYCISTTGWNVSANPNYWKVEFTTWLYDSIRVSSKQRASSTGPRKFRLDYSLDGASWTAVTGGVVSVANNFTTGVLNKVLLPNDVNSQPSVYLRWISISDTAVNGTDTISPAGTSRIDDIYITGRYNPILGVNCADKVSLDASVYPNPASDAINVRMTESADIKLELFSITGVSVLEENFTGNQYRMNLSDLAPGLYMLRITNTADMRSTVKKISVK